MIVHCVPPTNAECPECGSLDTHQAEEASPGQDSTYVCSDCGHEWVGIVPEPPEDEDAWSGGFAENH